MRNELLVAGTVDPDPSQHLLLLVPYREVAGGWLVETVSLVLHRRAEWGLFVCLSVRLSVCLSVCLLVCLYSVFMQVCLTKLIIKRARNHV